MGLTISRLSMRYLSGLNMIITLIVRGSMPLAFRTEQFFVTIWPLIALTYLRRLLRLAVRSRSRLLLGSIQRARCRCSRYTELVIRSCRTAEAGSQKTAERYLV